MARRARRIAVVGAGWAGLAAAVEATCVGHHVVVCDTAKQAGGRARGVGAWDNGQHILIGAYSQTLALMRRIGALPEALLWREPLALRRADGGGIALPDAAPRLAFAGGVFTAPGWPLAAKLALLREAWKWQRDGFACAGHLTVTDLCARLPAVLQRDLVDPLCIAALNTPPAAASGRVFLRVLHDALFTGPGGSDLLLPKAPLSALLPDPALEWLRARGAECRLRRRALTVERVARGWRLDGEDFDALILACGAHEAARLVAGIAPAWRQQALSLRHEAILSVVLHDPELRLPRAMTLLTGGPDAPAQFAFDLGRLGRARDCHAFVVSGAGAVLADGVAAAAQTVLRQARREFPGAFAAPDALRHAAAERRATFACTPNLQRPPAFIAPGLVAAGDHVDGPYPATLEGAVRSGIAAATEIDRL